MTKIAFLSSHVAVAGAMSREDFADAARRGFRSVVNNRPDHEEPGQLTAREEAAMARQFGLSYHHVPVGKHEVLECDALHAQEQVLGSIAGPVLVHCRSGLRSTIMWAALAVRAGSPLGEVLAAAAVAGHDLSAVCDEIQHAAEQLDASRREIRQAAA